MLKTEVEEMEELLDMYEDALQSKNLTIAILAIALTASICVNFWIWV